MPIQNNKLDATRHREDMFAHVMSQLKHAYGFLDTYMETDMLHKEIDVDGFGHDTNVFR